jgi:hypothetical protein
MYVLQYIWMEIIKQRTQGLISSLLKKGRRKSVVVWCRTSWTPWAVAGTTSLLFVVHVCILALPWLSCIQRKTRGPSTGRQPPPLYSVLYGIISKRPCVLPDNFSLEKNQGVPRELALIAISLACLVAQWNSFGGKGSWKWVTAFPSWDCPVTVCHLFPIPSYVHQQLLSLYCQNFVHFNSLVFLPILGILLVQGFIFERWPTIF